MDSLPLMNSQAVYQSKHANVSILYQKRSPPLPAGRFLLSQFRCLCPMTVDALRAVQPPDHSHTRDPPSWFANPAQV